MTAERSLRVCGHFFAYRAKDDGSKVRRSMVKYLPDLRSHEPPRNSGEGTAVNGPMPLAGGDESPSS